MFNTSTSGKINAYLKPLKTLVDRCQAAHPNARLLLFHPGSANYAKTYADLLRYCDESQYMGLDLLLSEETAGGLHSGTNVTHSLASHEVKATKVYDAGDADYPYVATVVYPHDVTFVDDEDNVITNEVVADGYAAVAPPNPTKAGFEFVGWDPADFSKVTNDLTVVAQFQVSGNNHMVTFEDYEGTVLKVMSVEDGQDAVPPEDVPEKGLAWEFTGWKPGYTNVTEDRVCVAQYQQKALVDIADADDLAEALADDIPATTTLKFTSDIDCDGEWTTVESFVGTLDGNGYAITNLPNDAMLFTTLEGTVKNLTFANVGNGTSYGHADRAIVAKQAKGALVSNCTFNACVRNQRATNARGALIFVATSTNSEGRITKILDCTARNSRLYCDSDFQGRDQRFGGFVAVGNHLMIERGRWLMDDPEVIAIGNRAGLAGGFIGQAATSNTVIGCYNEGKILLDHAYGNYGGAAGIIGGVSGKTFVYDCTNEAAIVGTHDSGAAGIVGAACKTTVTVGRCVNRGTIISDKDSSVTNPLSRGAGGIMGGAWGQNSYVKVFDCANYGAISTTTNATPAGGIMASLTYNNPGALISNCYNYASVYSESYAGGIIGRSFDRSYISLYNCGNVGTVTSKYEIAGGAIGLLDVQNKATVPIKGFLQAGAVVGGANSLAGGAVGMVTNNTGFVNRKINFESVVMLGTVTAGAGGQVGALVGGSDVYDETKKWTFTADENCRVLDASLPLWYDYNNEPVANAGDNAIPTMSTDGLTNKAAKKILDAYAAANGHERWVQTKNYPELARFGKEVRGMLLFFR